MTLETQSSARASESRDCEHCTVALTRCPVLPSDTDTSPCEDRKRTLAQCIVTHYTLAVQILPVQIG